LEQRFSASKLHYDIARRYSDRSFTQSLATLSEQDALTLYTEVLLKVQSHYVDAPNWVALVDRGTESLEIALGESEFVQRGGRAISTDQARKFSHDLRVQLARRQVRDR